MKITNTNVLESWAKNFQCVLNWVAKLQDKRRAAFRLYQYCTTVQKSPDDLLKLKNGNMEAEQLLDRFVSDDNGFSNSVKFNISNAVRSFYRCNYKALERESGKIELELKNEQHRPTKQELKILWENCFNPRDRAIISIASSSALAKESLINLQWKHLEPNWEEQDIPHISLGPELIKGHGKGKFKNVRQESFITPEAKEDLLKYREWMERKGKHFKPDDRVFVSAYAPYEPLNYVSLGSMMLDLQQRTGLKVSLHDMRRHVETALEIANVHSNLARKIRGRKVSGEESPYSQPKIDELREKYSQIVSDLQFRTEQIIPREEVASLQTDNEILRERVAKLERSMREFLLLHGP